MTKRRLTHDLISISGLTLCLGFILIYFSFHYVIRDYVNQMTREAMQTHFLVLDSINQKKDIPDIVSENNVFVWSQYAIVDQEKQSLFTSDAKQKKKDKLSTIIYWNTACKKPPKLTRA
ncbi:sensor histidine kinase [Streptococcus ictaluri]|uniref:Uncharacterized protein n=1 Tax=Streptococcus ictaluri 707-05 TaxID=764299 RepID=G5K519_9STRE|nr:hypothetical protein [Streptococcus ictaluri]EHI69078.1 hypothetical protein STRIC_1906 [Streptococcus ictaluri 707-05]